MEDQPACNGIIQVINRVLMPYPTLQLGGQVTGQRIVPINSDEYVKAFLM